MCLRVLASAGLLVVVAAGPSWLLVIVPVLAWVVVFGIWFIVPSSKSAATRPVYHLQCKRKK